MRGGIVLGLTLLAAAPWVRWPWPTRTGKSPGRRRASPSGLCSATIDTDGRSAAGRGCWP
jgi:hypothetical protein